MDADCTPNCQADSQMSQRAAAFVSPSPKTAVWASRSITSARNAASSVTRTPPLTCKAPADERSISPTLEYCTVDLLRWSTATQRRRERLGLRVYHGPPGGQTPTILP